MATSFFRKSIAGIVLAGGVLAGTAGIAAAETGTTPPNRPTQEQICERAGNAWDRLVALDARLREHYQKLGALRDKAAAEGKTELAEKLTQRMQVLKNRHELVVQRMKNLHDRYADKCDVPEAPTAALA